MTRALLPILLAALVISACASATRNSSEAAWRRGQCAQVLDEKLREKCLEAVDREFGHW